jgi:hypothetical protein
MSFFPVFDSTGGNFMDQIKPKYIKYQKTPIFKFFIPSVDYRVGFGPKKEVSGTIIRGTLKTPNLSW